jgi:vitamin B12/bleomycin/antimicrobial peptide transport system ATP-binding/permease protein
VNNIRSTLSILWRVAAPYFRSEDKLAGWGLLAAVIAIELALVGNSVLINQSFLYRPAGERLGRV